LPFEPKLAVVLVWVTIWGLTGSKSVPAAEPPQARIANGQIRVNLYLPDARNGFYRGTRFDWSGIIASLEYKGHNYYGPWFNRLDPKVYDYRFEGDEVVASPCVAATGPAEEFQTDERALGWDEAKVGGTFIKIGVGVLRKDEGAYDIFKQYEIVDPGKWSVKRDSDSIEFTQELADPSSGYSYVYRKTVRLINGEPEMVLEHNLRNTGSRTIRSAVYNHNFLVLDKKPTGPDFSITVPYQIHPASTTNQKAIEIRGNQIVFLKILDAQDDAYVYTPLLGFGATPKDYEIRIENRRLGAGMSINGDRPLSSEVLFANRVVLAMEPYITMKIDPGAEFTWKIIYRYYTLPSNAR
jgi:hypothetical protein